MKTKWYSRWVNFMWFSMERTFWRITRLLGTNERGISNTFSKDVVREFFENNDLDLICRAQQVVEEGYEFYSDMRLVTIFSAPNYMGEFNNNGGILSINQDLLCSFHIINYIFSKEKKKKVK